jgi:hypothetical protein
MQVLGSSSSWVPGVLSFLFIFIFLYNPSPWLTSLGFKLEDSQEEKFVLKNK